MLSPRFDVVNVERAAAVSAVAARPVIAQKNIGAERSIARRLRVRQADWRLAAAPVWVRLTDQMCVARRDIASRFDAPADGGAMLVGKCATSKSSSDAFALGGWYLSARGRRLSYSRRADLRPRLDSLRGVCLAIAPRLAARARAEACTLPDVRIQAVVADALIAAGHE